MIPGKTKTTKGYYICLQIINFLGILLQDFKNITKSCNVGRKPFLGVIKTVGNLEKVQ